MSRNVDRPRSRTRWIKWVVIGVVALIALGGGLLAWYILSSDSPDPLDADDLSAALTETTVAEATVAPDADTTAVDEPAATTAPSATPDTTAAPGTTAAPAGDGVDGTWAATDASVVRYRVDEVLFGANVTAVGETNAVTGSLSLAGTNVTDAAFEVDMATVESDRSQRDGQFRGRIMSVDEFPTSTFTLTAPIELGAIPAEGEQVTATAIGDLTLRGVTNPVTFEVTAQLEGDRIGVLGSIPIVFEDYDIPNPSFGGIETEDNGVLEFVLVFQRG